MIPRQAQGLHPLGAIHGVDLSAQGTLVLASFFVVGGMFRLLGAFATRLPNWPFMALGGLITLILGLAVWQHWPYDAPWFIRLCVGVDTLLQGIAMVSLALVVRVQEVTA